jgi:hypothetical protein
MPVAASGCHGTRKSHRDHPHLAFASERGVVVGRGIGWYWVILRGFEADLGCSSFGWFEVVLGGFGRYWAVVCNSKYY